MPAFEREQILTQNDLNWYLEVAGTLTDPYEISYQIWDIVDDPTGGTQIFPATPDEWEDVTAGGRFGTGKFYTYDNAEARGYQIPADARIGSYRVKWRWKAAETSPYRYGQEDFNVVLEAGGVDTYIDISDVRAAGVAVDVASDSEVLASILLWQEFFDRACRQWFLPRELTIQFDGNNSDVVHLGVPVVSVEYLRINGSSNDLDASLYEVYGNAASYPMHRRNPRIKLKHSTQVTDIHVAPYSYGELKFWKGYKNQVVKGIFGYVEPDLSAPLLIQRGLLKLVCEKLTRPIVPGDDAPEPSSTTFAGVVVEEKTDGHSIKYGGGVTYNARRPGLSGITSDPEILDIIKLHRAPLGIAMPSHWSYY